MKECILEFKDLTDSREMLDAKAPNFMVWSIYVILSILFGALLWMWFSKMDIVVKAQGIVRPNTVVSSIVNVNDGIIKNLNFYEGKKVKIGVVLY
jgi:multidrug efflux pump subunit AcrA (membrane-fusion protein)